MSLTKLASKKPVCPLGKPQVRLADGHGLYLEVTAAGGKYSGMKHRQVGKEKRLTLGVYSAVPLVDARKKRDKMHIELATGARPGQIDCDAKVARALLDATTFEKVAFDFAAIADCGKARQWRGAVHASVIRSRGIPRIDSQVLGLSQASACTCAQRKQWCCWPSTERNKPLMPLTKLQAARLLVDFEFRPQRSARAGALWWSPWLSNGSAPQGRNPPGGVWSSPFYLTTESSP